MESNSQSLFPMSSSQLFGEKDLSTSSGNMRFTSNRSDSQLPYLFENSQQQFLLNSQRLEGLPSQSPSRTLFRNSSSQRLDGLSSQSPLRTLFRNSSSQRLEGLSSQSQSRTLFRNSSSQSLFSTGVNSINSTTNADLEQQRHANSLRALQNEIKSQKEKVLLKIEGTILSVIEAISEGRLPCLERNRVLKSAKDVKRAKLKPNSKTRVDFGGRGAKPFCTQILLMSNVYKMIRQNQTSTIRDLFYENVNFFGRQARLSSAINELTGLLQVPRETLCIEASAKGLVAGSITFTDANGNEINASNSRHGIIVPSRLQECIIKTDARFVLFVEKDAIFQRLIEEDIFKELNPMIMITGKGYPDMQTRRLMSILNKNHQLKVFAMVDCDPYGVEIASIVKWGSYNCNYSRNENGDLISKDMDVPNLIWLGLLPSEVSTLTLTLNASIEFSDRDKTKMNSVIERINLENHKPWLEEALVLQGSARKTELEALFSSPYFTTKVYLRSKIRSVIDCS